MMSKKLLRKNDEELFIFILEARHAPQASQLQEKGWQPHWFRKEKGKDTFQYTGGYWEARKDSNWKDCPDIFGPDLPEMPAE